MYTCSLYIRVRTIIYRFASSIFEFLWKRPLDDFVTKSTGPTQNPLAQHKIHWPNTKYTGPSWASGFCVGPVDFVLGQWILCWASGFCVGPVDFVWGQWILCGASGFCVGLVDFVWGQRIFLLGQWILCWASGFCVGLVDFVLGQWILCWASGFCVGPVDFVTKSTGPTQNPLAQHKIHWPNKKIRWPHTKSTSPTQNPLAPHKIH